MFVWFFSEHQGRIVNKDYCTLCMETPKKSVFQSVRVWSRCVPPYPNPSGILFHGPSFP